MFRAEGFKVARNTPFAGAYTAQTYGRPSHGSHVVQIEIDRSLYMNETELRPNGNFDGMRRILSRVIAELAEIGRPDAARPAARRGIGRGSRAAEVPGRAQEA